MIGRYPRTQRDELEQTIELGASSYDSIDPHDVESIAGFLDLLADTLDRRADQLVAIAHAETALPQSPRLKNVELPRTTGQLRQAAEAARTHSWRRPVISPSSSIGSYRAPIPGPVVVMGPNNFPFAFNAIAGGDFAAAVATGHPVIAKANPGHPETTRLMAELTHSAATEVGLPPAMVQLLYDVDPEDGLRLVSDSRVAATAFTGSRTAGLKLKQAADRAGRPIYLEMSSLNPVIVLPDAAAERSHEIAHELASSVTLGAGQFCTKPGVIFVIADAATDEFIAVFSAALAQIDTHPLLSADVHRQLDHTLVRWTEGGADRIATGTADETARTHPSSLFQVDAETFVQDPERLQAEAFGNAALVVVAADDDQLLSAICSLDGNLTGTIYSAISDPDENRYRRVETVLRPNVGRLLNDKPPTGVAVVPAMHHGGPFPSTGHPGFTSVGIPASLERFTMLQCYDAVRDHRLPPHLQADNPLDLLRDVDGKPTTDPISWG